MKPVAEAIDLIHNLRGRKAMYFETATPEAVESFVASFVVACTASWSISIRRAFAVGLAQGRYNSGGWISKQS